LKTPNVTCTKTAQRNVSKLIDKGFIVRTKEGNEQKPGSCARYQIVPEQKVEDKRLENGLTHFVEIGLARKAVPDPEQRTESGA
jgi:predicted transcriptional regulator